MGRVVMVDRDEEGSLHAKDTGANGLIGGVSKTSQGDFVLEPYINYYKF
jgi:hypothetical protein